MYVFLTILVVLASVLMMLVVLIQNPKGSGLSSAFGGSGASNQMMGVQRTTNVLEKATWGLAIFIFAVSIAMNLAKPGKKAQTQGEVEKQLQQSAPPARQDVTQTPDIGNIENLPSQGQQQSQEGGDQPQNN